MSTQEHITQDNKESAGTGAPSRESEILPKRFKAPDEVALQSLLSWAVPRYIEGKCEELNNEATQYNEALSEGSSSEDRMKADWNLSWSIATPANQSQSTGKFNGSGYDMLALVGAKHVFLLEHKVMSAGRDEQTKKLIDYRFESSEDQLSFLSNHDTNETPCYLSFLPPQKTANLNFFPNFSTSEKHLKSVILIRAKPLLSHVQKPVDGHGVCSVTRESLNQLAIQKDFTNVHTFMNQKIFTIHDGSSGNPPAGGHHDDSTERIATLAEVMAAGNHVDNLTLFVASHNYVLVRSYSEIVNICVKLADIESNLNMAGKIALRRLSIALLEQPDQLDNRTLKKYFSEFESALDDHIRDPSGFGKKLLTIGYANGPGTDLLPLASAKAFDAFKTKIAKLDPGSQKDDLLAMAKEVKECAKKLRAKNTKHDEAQETSEKEAQKKQKLSGSHI